MKKVFLALAALAAGMHGYAQSVELSGTTLSPTIKKRVPGSFMGHVNDEKSGHFSPSLLLGATLHAGLQTNNH